MIKLRDYQQECVDVTISHLKKSTDPVVIEAATGAGKSLIVAELARWLRNIAPSKKVLCLAPSKELVEQNHSKYLMTGEQASIFCASAGGKCLNNPVVFCSPLTTHNAIDVIATMPIVAIIIDESHGLTNTVLNIVEAVRKHNANCRIIGLSATPYRMNTGYIYEHDEDGEPVPAEKAKEPFFKQLVYRITAPELIRRGYLTAPMLLETTSEKYDTSELELNKLGRFNDDEIAQIFEHSSLTEKIVNEIIKESEQCQGVLIFASTIKHAETILDLLPLGDCRLVTGTTPKKERDEIIMMFKAKMFKFLVNVAVLTTGFDAPHVDFIAVLRPTESRGLFQQIIGRGTRLDDNKDSFIVFDCADNIVRHGLSHSDMFNPELMNVGEDSEFIGEEVTCPTCSHINFNKWVKVKGKVISTLRRCANRMPIEGIENPVLKKHFYRCSYMFKFKECPECGSENDITARTCRNCKLVLIDPNDKLRLGTRTTTFEHNVRSFVIHQHHSRSGHDGFKAIINGVYTKYFAIHTKRGAAEYEKAKAQQPTKIIVKTSGKFPDIELIY